MTHAAAAITSFEADLIRLLRALLGHEPIERAVMLVREVRPLPRGLSASAVWIVEDVLAKSTIRFLLEGGGWRAGPFLRSGKPLAGHPWTTVAEAERRLQFSPILAAFLMWLTSQRPSTAQGGWAGTSRPLTAADQLTFARCALVLQHVPAEWLALRKTAPFAGNPFLALLGPHLLADANAAAIDFNSLFMPPASLMIECLQDRLEQAWHECDRALGAEADWVQLRHRGRMMEDLTSEFLASADAAGRRDLTEFLLKVIRKRLTPDAAITDWTGSLAGTGPRRRADRQATQHAALGIVRAIRTFDRWNRGEQGVGYFDEGYAASQHFKAMYEANDGPRLKLHFDRIERTLDPLAKESA